MMHPSPHPAPAFVNGIGISEAIPKLKNPIINTTAGTYFNSRLVLASNPNLTGSVFYRINSGAESLGSSVNLTETGLIEFQVREIGFLPSDWVGVFIQIKCSTGNPIPPAGTYDNRFSINVKFSNLNPGAVTYYTIDGSAPTILSPVYDSVLGIDLSVDTDLRWFSVKSNTINSDFGDAVYIFELILDPDVEAYLTVTGQGSEALLLAGLNDFVINAKSAGLWDLITCMYAFYGTTLNQNKYNVKDPQDTDAAFRLTFLGGWSFSKNGATGNGLPGTWINTHNNTQSEYLTSGGVGLCAAFAMGLPTNRVVAGYSFTSPTRTLTVQQGAIETERRTIANTSALSASGDTDFRAITNVIRSDGTNFSAFDASVVSGTHVSVIPFNPGPVFIGDQNRNGAGTSQRYTRQIRGVLITKLLTTTQANALNNLLNAFNAIVRT